jgi:hypothetical protein
MREAPLHRSLQTSRAFGSNLLLLSAEPSRTSLDPEPGARFSTCLHRLQRGSLRMVLISVRRSLGHGMSKKVRCMMQGLWARNESEGVLQLEELEDLKVVLEVFGHVGLFALVGSLESSPFW